ncbi:MAG TPA: branched-chain amino acid ABC transporter ATP-binding protein/permease, partial [Methylomirabilota bacterium]|nr:branched-chain amino acid ABC transporter ATP-binding protein/permease [Methylomirabilota bacterium]
MRGLVLAAVVLATAPLYADYTPFYLGLLTEVLVFGLFALAYDVLLGHAGVLSLGHSAFLGVAAYTAGILLARFRLPLELSILAGALGGLATSLILGLLVLRKRGVYLAMLTLALSQVFYYVVLMWTPVTGGTDGLGNLPILHLSDPLGWRLSKRPITRYYVIATVIFVAMLAIRHLLGSPLGRVMRAVKANETRAAACGYDTRRVKLAAFAVSGLFSGLAGALLTVVLEFVPIENIHWGMSGAVLIMALFGGTGTLLGPFVGAGVFIWMRDFLSKYLEYWEVFVGGAFVLIVLFLPDGIVGSLTRLLARRRPVPVAAAEDALPDPARLVAAPGRANGAGGDGGLLLESRGLTKTFGGLTAVNGVDFQVRAGELRSVIGPNGAGKTTFFNLLTGVLPPSGGRILFKGRDVTGLPAHRVSRLGIARSYQVTNIFGDLTVFENVRIAAQSRVTHYRFWGNAERLRSVSARADEILQHLGLAAKRDALARELSHGEQRYLEIGIALATEPDFLLLDEPTAGMSPDETRRTAA